jgi:SAM-dependent methyltransferase
MISIDNPLLTLESNTVSSQHQYPWLNRVVYSDAYLPPHYYDAILKPYVFDGMSDLELFRRFLGAKLVGQRLHHILELGAGTGRATTIALEALRSAGFTLLDKSHAMVAFLRTRIPPLSKTNFVCGDALSYLCNLDDQVDFAYSLWSLSHSIHQSIARDGLRLGSQLSVFAIENLIINCLRPNGFFYLVHFDSTSDEQTICLRQRAKVFPWFRPKKHSPSKVIIDQALMRLEEAGYVQVTMKHMDGNEITYSDLDEALEIFMNLHLEGYFNASPMTEEVIREMSEELLSFRQGDGRIRVRPACFIYECRRLEKC